jgi:hypothetical protein
MTFFVYMKIFPVLVVSHQNSALGDDRRYFSPDNPVHASFGEICDYKCDDFSETPRVNEEILMPVAHQMRPIHEDINPVLPMLEVEPAPAGVVVHERPPFRNDRLQISKLKCTTSSRNPLTPV